MISFTTKQNKGNTELSIIGEAVFEHAGEIFNEIKEIYNKNANLLIITHDVAVADISFLQILLSAYQSFSKKNLVFELNKKLSSAVKGLLFESGFIDLKPSDSKNTDIEIFDSFARKDDE